MRKSRSVSDRRDFLKLAATGAAAIVAGDAVAAQQAEIPAPRVAGATAGAGTAAGAAAGAAAQADPLSPIRAGSDFMLDVIKSLGFEYVAANPGSSYRSLHESTVNYGANRDPELLTCLHEEASVAIAHGYFKIEGKPMATYMYGTVGLQHAAMAIYSAYCDRVPVVILVGNDADVTNRASRTDINHSAQDVGQMVRDFTKWDDAPVSLNAFAESTVRAYKIAMTPPAGPVVIAVDKYLQERAIPDGTKLRIPKFSPTTPPEGDHNAVAEAAKLLVNAEFPVILTERAARTEAGLKYMVELAELLQAAVVDNIQRMCFPSRHPLNQAAEVIPEADVILSLENPLLWSAVNAADRDSPAPGRSPGRSRLKAGAKIITISSLDLFSRSNYGDLGRYQEVDLSIGADAEETLPSLIEQVKRLITADRKTAFQARGAKLAAAHQRTNEGNLLRASYGWNDSPLSTARIAAEVWAQIKDKDWSMVSNSNTMSDWPQRLWDFNKFYHHIGQAGSVGIGYSAPASVGAALANRKHGRLSINFQNDGDLMYQPGVLWTAAHHRIPMLTVMHNNRAYNTEVMEVQNMAGQHHRDVGRCLIGTAIDNPAIDYASVAKGLGWYAEGPITNPNELAPAIRRALAVVERGQPALLDTVTQPT